MSTININRAEILALAKRTERDRKINYCWQSQGATEVLEHTNEPVGVQIDISVEHDPKRKQYRVIARKAHYEIRNDRFQVTHWSPFHPAYWSHVIAITPAGARFSRKALEQAEQSFLNDESLTVAKILEVIARETISK